MAVDTPVEEARKLMGERIKAYRTSKGLRVEDVAEATGIDKTTIYGIEAGRFNFTIDMFAKLLIHYKISFYDFLVGLKEDGYNEHDRELHRKLQVILDSNLPFHVQGITLNLQAIQELVERTLNPRRGRAGEDSERAKQGEKQSANVPKGRKLKPA